MYFGPMEVILVIALTCCCHSNYNVEDLILLKLFRLSFYLINVFKMVVAKNPTSDLLIYFTFFSLV